MESTIKVLIVSAEAVPFAKVGGLADVAGSLPRALKNLGVEIALIMPKYGKINIEKYNLKKVTEVEVLIGPDREIVAVYQDDTTYRFPVYFIAHQHYFEREEIYGCPDDLKRFTLFDRAILEMLKRLDFKVDVIHANDWHTALIPAYLKTIYREDSFFSKTCSVYTIHNLGYQGLFEKSALEIIGLPWEEFTMDKLEYYGKVNFMKTGIVYADVVTTVSEKYAQEIQTKDFGAGLEGLLKAQSHKLYGIINGIDYEVWNPATDKFLMFNFDKKDLTNKEKNKRLLQKEKKLPLRKTVPLIGMISRLAEQKGFDLLEECLEELLLENLQFIILGTGDKCYEEFLKNVAQKYPHKISVNLEFNNTLAHEIYAACDFFLMPSRYEPCGLGQMIALTYGTIPIVRKTGGLADTVIEFNPDEIKGNGFLFEEYKKSALVEAIKKAVSVFMKKKIWKRLQISAMEYDYSWENSAQKYITLYKTAMNNK